MKLKFSSISTTTALVAGLLCTVHVASAQTAVEQADMIIDERLYKILDQDMVKIPFEKNSAALTDKTLTAVANFAKSAKSEAKVEKYLVVSWGDQEYPAKGELSKSERKLATERSEHIKKALGAAGASKVDAFEMTKRPNWIQRAFSTEGAEIKGKGSNISSNDRLLKEIGRRLREEGGPRSAVIVAKFKNEI